MNYSSYSYLYPPRPELAIDPKLIPAMEKRGMIAEVKKNGTNNVIFVSPEREIITMTRHAESHRQWEAQPDVMQAFTDLSGQGWYVFVAELLHNKVKGIRDVNYLHDVLVHDGEYLVGYTQEERKDILYDLFVRDGMEETYSHVVVNPNLWIAQEYEEDFVNLFNSLTNDEDEGLVFKNPKQRLGICSKPKSNSESIKCRKHHRNYSF